MPDHDEQRRKPLEDLSDAGLSILRVFAEVGSEPLALNQLVFSTGVQTTDIEALLRGELRWWIDKRIKQNVRRSGGFLTWVYHSQMRDAERKSTLQAFRSHGPSVLFACRCLDEGIDLPDVDAAILVSSTQSTRQRIQRIGRVLRRGDGDKKPIVVTLMASGTRDEAVTDSDRAEFEGVARIKTIHGEKACIAALLSLAEG